jgi:hypothetical protein
MTRRIVASALLVIILAATATLKADTLLLGPGAILWPNQDVWAEGCQFVYQADGNLVLYCGGVAWHAGTHGTSPGAAVMQYDGNLVVYDGNGNPIWNTKTNTHDGAHLIVSNGNVVLKSPSGVSNLWWGGLWPVRWFPGQAVQFYDAGWIAYWQRNVAGAIVQWHYYYKTPGSECHWAFPAILSILRTAAGYDDGTGKISYLSRPCNQ